MTNHSCGPELPPDAPLWVTPASTSRAIDPRKVLSKADLRQYDNRAIAAAANVRSPYVKQLCADVGELTNAYQRLVDEGGAVLPATPPERVIEVMTEALVVFSMPPIPSPDVIRRLRVQCRAIAEVSYNALRQELSK